MKQTEYHTNSYTDKCNPASIEAERAVLGAVLIDPTVQLEVFDLLPNSEVFYHTPYRLIYEAILDLNKNAEPIDLLMVVNRLKKNGTHKSVGGSEVVLKLSNYVNYGVNVVSHSLILKEMFMRRRFIESTLKTLPDAYDFQGDVFEMLDKIQADLFDISEQNTRQPTKSVADILPKLTKEIEERSNKKSGIVGIPTGFTDLDAVTAGLQKSDLVIVGARPGMGKTAFALSAARSISVDYGIPSAFFSLEMSKEQIVERLISMQCRINNQLLKTGKLSNEDWEKMVSESNVLFEAPLFIDDTPALSLRELRTKTRRLKIEKGIQIIFIDYIGLMTGEVRKNGNREEEIATISRGLKQLAKELEIPVVVLSQLNRQLEMRGGDKRPQTSDLRSSGALEQDADKIFLLYRADIYGITEDINGNSTEGFADVIIAKHRNGDLGTVEMKFVGEYTLYEDKDTKDNDFFDSTESEAVRTGIIRPSQVNDIPNPDFLMDTSPAKIEVFPF